MNKVPVHILEIAIKESLKNYESIEDCNSLADLYFYHDLEDNSLVIYDEADHVLNRVSLPDYKIFNLSYTLRQVLQQANRERLFERDYILKPFTVSLVDKDFAVIEELLFLDDDTMKVNNTIWANIEKDLDEFIDNLLQ